MKKLFSKAWPILVYIILGVVIFAPTFGKYILLPSPDSPPPITNEPLKIIAELLSGTVSIAPHDLLRLILPPLFAHDFLYLFDTILAAIFFAFFLTTRKVPTLHAAVFGGAYAFMGYSFTLFSAGHRGFFFMTTYIMLLLAFLSKAFFCQSTKKSIIFFILAAYSATFAIRYQPDMAIILIALAAVYGVYLLVSTIRASKKISSQSPAKKRIILGVVTAILAFALSSFPTMKTTLTSTLEHRKNQITQATTQQTTTSQSATSQSAEQDKWIFATNWSLPPSETIEFIAPAIFGRDTGDPTCPYWGELGRSWKWEETQQGFFNFRQHIIYLGIIPVSFAIFALITLFTRKKDDERSVPSPQNSEIIFWTAIAAVALILAFGRYTPLYKLFYSIPYMSYLRAPVKFMRIVELSTAILGAIGFFRFTQTAPKKKSLCAFAAISIVSLIALSAFASYIAIAPNAFTHSLIKIGAGNIAQLMAKNAIHAILHAIVGLSLVTVLTLIKCRIPLTPQLLSALLTIAIASDIAIVSRPFVRPQDYELLYNQKNPITALFQKEKKPHTLACLVENQNLGEAIRTVCGHNNISTQPKPELKHGDFLSQPQSGGLDRLLELTGCNYAVVDVKQSRLLSLEKNILVSILEATQGPALFSKKLVPSQNDFFLFEIVSPEPYAKLYSNWEHATKERHLSKVAKIMGPKPALTIVVSKDLPRPKSAHPGTATLTRASFVDGSTETEIETSASSDQVLSILTPYHPNYIVKIDGIKTDYFMAGYSMVGVLVPEGKHVVTISTYDKDIPVASASAGVLLLFFIFLLIVALPPKTKKTPPKSKKEDKTPPTAPKEELTVNVHSSTNTARNEPIKRRTGDATPATPPSPPSVSDTQPSFTRNAPIKRKGPANPN